MPYGDVPREIFEKKIQVLMGVLSRSLRRVDHSDGWSFYGVVIGASASGKTTLALTLASVFTKMYSNSRCYITTNLSYLDPERIRSLDGRNVAVVFDDVSNRIRRVSDELTRLYTIRHPHGHATDTIGKNVFMLFICHYLRSVAPFIRSTPLRVLSSITEAEIRAYSSEYLFTLSSLWDYLEYVYTYPHRYIILASSGGREHIIDVTHVVLNECEFLE